MISLSKKIFYAVEAVLYIAYNAGQGPITSRDIAERQGLSPRYLEQLMQKLVRGGLLRGVRGPHGGYVLAKERRRITVGEICAILGDDKEDEQAGYTSTPLGSQIVQPVWEAAQRAIGEHLKQVNLAALCEQAAQRNVRKSSDEKLDFNI